MNSLRDDLIATCRRGTPLRSAAVIASLIKGAFSSIGLGIVAITDVPNLPERRIRLIRLSHKLAALPTNQLDEMTFPKSSYQVGWVSGVPPRQKIIEYTYTPPVARLSIFRTLIPLLSRATGARSWRAKIGLQPCRTYPNATSGSFACRISWPRCQQINWMK